MRALAKINRTGRDHDPHPSRDADHVALDEEHRTARSTAVNTSPSTPAATRTTAPASSTSMLDRIASRRAAGTPTSALTTIGANDGGIPPDAAW